MQLFRTVARGLERLLHHQKLLFLVLLLFILPLLTLVVLERFGQAAEANIATAEQQKIGSIHDAISAVVTHAPDSLPVTITSLARTNPELTKIRVYEVNEDTTTVLASANAQEVGSTTTVSTILNTGRVSLGETFSITVTDAATQYVQSVRTVITPTQETIIFTEQDRTQFVALTQARTQDAYLILTLLFVALIVLGYWINRQVDWRRRYQSLSGTLEERDLFTNMIAHEFRSPLTAIKGYVSFLQESPHLTAEEKRFTDTIASSSERLVLLVNDFLEIARIQSGKLSLEMTDVNVVELINKEATLLKHEAREKGLDLNCVVSSGEHILHTDKHRVTQIITNIVSNSIKYTEQGGIQVLLESNAHYLTIRVKDTGSGISASDQAKLFQPFARVGGVEKTTVTGTGLGMWITKQLTELLGGTIAVESIEGIGTQIVITFDRHAFLS